MNTSKGLKTTARLVGFLGLLVSGTLQTAQAVNPTSVKIKLYEMRLSPNDSCTNAVTVFANTSPTAQDLINGPTLGAGAIPQGTYRCMMVRMSDQITYIPASTTGSCTGGQTYTSDVYRPGTETGVAPDGTSVTATSGEDFPWEYFKVTAGTGQSCSEGANSPCLMASPLTVTGDRTVTVVVDFDNQINGTQVTCDLEPPVFSFR